MPTDTVAAVAPGAEAAKPADSAMPSWSDADLAAKLTALDAPEAEPPEVKAPEAEKPADDAEPKTDETGEEKAEDVEEAEPEPSKKAKAEFTPEQQAIFDKRVGKEVAKRKELQEKLDAEAAARAELAATVEELKQRLDAAPAAAEEPKGPGAKGSGDVLTQFNTVAEVERRMDEVESLLEWAAEHWDGYEGDDKTGPIEAKVIRMKHAQLSKELNRDLPRAADLIRKREEVTNTVVRAAYPALLDAKSPEAVIARNFLARYPALKSDPNVYLLIGDMLRGEAARIAEAKKGTKPTATAPAKAPVEKPPAAPAASRPAAESIPKSETGAESSQKLNDKIKKAASKKFDRDALEDVMADF